MQRRGFLGGLLALTLPLGAEARARTGSSRKTQRASSSGGGSRGGCGSRGGAGYRKANGKCAGRNE